MVIISCLLVIQGCEKFVTIPSPKDQMDQVRVFESEESALSAMASVYFKLSESGQGFASGSHSSITMLGGLYADELISYQTTGSSSYDFYLNSVTPVNGSVSSVWGNAYNIIYETNRIIEGLNVSVAISQPLKRQLLGEAIFIRSFCHFYLVNLFGDIPLVTTSDYTVNSGISRTPINQVYERIISDLNDAKELLSDQYPSSDRVRINKGAATAMLARVCLYTKKYADAEAESNEVIERHTQYKLESDLTKVFLATSDEAIWQIMPQGGIITYTYEGLIFILFTQPIYYAMRDNLYLAFDQNDLRRQHWIGSVSSTSGLTTWYFPYKYKQNSMNGSRSENSMVLRLAEQFLIRAEARAHQNKLTGTNSAESDINIIRNRAGLGNTTATSQTDLLIAIEKERNLELFTEWGHRFFDLKRTGRLNDVLPMSKPNWNPTDALLPIPQSELLINQNLQPQNNGY